MNRQHSVIDDLDRMLPNWRLIYDNDLRAAAEDCGLGSYYEPDDDPGLRELDFSDDAEHTQEPLDYEDFADE